MTPAKAKTTTRKADAGGITDLDRAVVARTRTPQAETFESAPEPQPGQLTNASIGQHIGGAELAGEQLARDRTLTGPIDPDVAANEREAAEARQ